LPLAQDGVARPRRVGHTVLPGLAVVSRHVPRPVGTVPCVVHGQLPAQRVVGVRAGGTRGGLPQSRHRRQNSYSRAPTVAIAAADRPQRQGACRAPLQRSAASAVWSSAGRSPGCPTPGRCVAPAGLGSKGNVSHDCLGVSAEQSLNLWALPRDSSQALTRAIPHSRHAAEATHPLAHPVNRFSEVSENIRLM
jgi:hypothetical protein